VSLVGTYVTGTPPGNFANGGFETTAGWVFSGIASRATTGTAHGGVAYSTAGSSTTGTGTTSQTFVVPATGNSLRYWYNITTSETTTTTQYDKLFVEVVNSSGTVTTVATYSNLNKNTAYAQSAAFSLAAFAGQTITLRFRATMDSSLITTFRIDDVTVQ
jgi:hypothetical protein